ncbi:MAG: type II toxin-antitoxin system RelE/ParE family toxin [Desulfamplus sp.]|nr:type II toxin-antitoxin system RelE/ParE family toxin [Desulfamplus sp.]
MYKIEYTQKFKRRIKKLSKRYTNIKKDYAHLLEELKQGNLPGDQMQSFPGTVYKVRVASSDQKKGKSGGFRFIYYVIFDDNTAYMMTVYAKSKKTDLSSQDRQEITDFIISLQAQTEG